jgi:transcriptional regulator with XRE-family HTH domain
MLPAELQSPREIAHSIAARVRALRLERGWTQEEIAARSGIALATYRAFERTGQISLVRLMQLAVILDAQPGLKHLFALPPARSLDDLERQEALTSRKRGRRRDASP